MMTQELREGEPRAAADYVAAAGIADQGLWTAAGAKAQRREVLRRVIHFAGDTDSFEFLEWLIAFEIALGDEGPFSNAQAVSLLGSLLRQDAEKALRRAKEKSPTFPELKQALTRIARKNAATQLLGIRQQEDEDDDAFCLRFGRALDVTPNLLTAEGARDLFCAACAHPDTQQRVEREIADDKEIHHILAVVKDLARRYPRELTKSTMAIGGGGQRRGRPGGGRSQRSVRYGSGDRRECCNCGKSGHSEEDERLEDESDS